MDVEILHYTDFHGVLDLYIQNLGIPNGEYEVVYEVNYNSECIEGKLQGEYKMNTYKQPILYVLAITVLADNKIPPINGGTTYGLQDVYWVAENTKWKIIF